jgi:hypothetical protein
VTPSKGFFVDWDREPITLRVREGSTYARDLGTVFVVAGVLTMAVGFVTVVGCLFCTDGEKVRATIPLFVGPPIVAAGFVLHFGSGTGFTLSTQSAGAIP